MAKDNRTYLVSDRDVGAVLHVLRIKRGITQEGVADEVNRRFDLGVQQSTISKIENGGQSLDIQLTAAISASLDFPVIELLECAAIHGAMEREDRGVSLSKLESELVARLSGTERASSDELRGASLALYSKLQQILVCGEHPAGSIVSVKAISKQSGCHLNTARKAMKQLVKEGFAQFIGDDAIAKTGFNEEYLISLILRRFSMEARAVKGLIDKKVSLSALLILKEEMAGRHSDEVDQLAVLVQDDALFHQTIFRLAGQSQFEHEIGTILRHIIIGLGSYRNELRQKEIVHEHGDLIDALQEGDFSSAFACLRTHLLSGAPSSMSERIDRELPIDFEEMLIRDRTESFFATLGSESQLF